MRVHEAAEAVCSSLFQHVDQVRNVGLVVDARAAVLDAFPRELFADNLGSDRGEERTRITHVEAQEIEAPSAEPGKVLVGGLERERLADERDIVLGRVVKELGAADVRRLRGGRLGVGRNIHAAQVHRPPGHVAEEAVARAQRVCIQLGRVREVGCRGIRHRCLGSGGTGGCWGRCSVVRAAGNDDRPLHTPIDERSAPAKR